MSNPRLEALCNSYLDRITFHQLHRINCKNKHYCRIMSPGHNSYLCLGCSIVTTEEDICAAGACMEQTGYMTCTAGILAHLKGVSHSQLFREMYLTRKANSNTL